MRRALRWLGPVALLAAACGGGSGGGGDGMASEPLRGRDAAHAAVRGALTLTSAMSVLVFDAPGGAARAVALRALPGAPAAVGAGSHGVRAVRVACPLGGSADSDCRGDATRTVVSTDLADCAIADRVGGRIVTSSGRLTVTVEAPRLCGLPVPAVVAVTTEMRGFRAVVTENGEVVDDLSASRLTQRYEPGDGGCGGLDGVTTATGELEARRAGVDVALQMRDLVVVVDSHGLPCVQTAVADGELAVRDRLRGGELRAELAGFRITGPVQPAAGALVGVAGAVASQCFGTAEIETEMMFPSDAVCPALGVILAEIDDGTRVRASFTAEGVLLDDGVDGVVDAELTSCTSDLPVCG